MRSRALHEVWLAALPGAVLRLEGDRSVEEQLTQIEVIMAAGLPLSRGVSQAGSQW